MVGECTVTRNKIAKNKNHQQNQPDLKSRWKSIKTTTITHHCFQNPKTISKERMSSATILHQQQRNDAGLAQHAKEITVLFHTILGSRSKTAEIHL